MMLKAKLVVVGGDAKAKEVVLRLPTVIGRGKDVTLTLPHPLVSRRHTEVFEKDGALFVRDLGSLNGTYVNNRRIKAEQKLPPNHLLTLGNVTFRAVYQCAEMSASMATDATQRNEDETVNFEDLDGPNLGDADPKQSKISAAVHDSNALLDDVVPQIPNFSSAVETGSETGSETNQRRVANQPVTDQPEDPQILAALKVPLNASDHTGDRVDYHVDNSAAKELEPEIEPELESDGAEAAVEELGSVQSSSIFAGDEAFLAPEKSISVSALEALPSQSASQSVSLVVQSLEGLGGTGDVPAVDSIDLDVGSDQKMTPLSDSDLGSFLKKIPR